MMQVMVDGRMVTMAQAALVVERPMARTVLCNGPLERIYAVARLSGGLYAMIWIHRRVDGGRQLWTQASDALAAYGQELRNHEGEWQRAKG